MSKYNLLAPGYIERAIVFIRGQRVILDTELAKMFGVPTFRLNEAVKRNRTRFPVDFMFQLTEEESKCLTSQIAMSNGRRGGRRTLPLAFTEHGVLMAANVLKSDRAVTMSLYVVRAFVRLREVLATHKELAQQVRLLESKIDTHDQTIQAIIETLRRIMQPQEPPKRKIGFTVDEPAVAYRVRRKKIR